MSKETFETNYEIKTKYLWHSTQIYCLTFDRTGKFIFTGGDDGNVRIYSLSRDRLIKCLSDESETQFAEEVESFCRNNDIESKTNIDSQTEMMAICDIAVNFENTLIAAAKYSGSIPVWNLQTFQLVIKLEEQVFPIRSIRFSPTVFGKDQKYLVSTSNDGFIFFYAYDNQSLKFSPKSLHRRGKYDGERAVNICCDNTSGGLLFGVIHTFGLKNEVSKPKSKKELIHKNDIQSAIRLFSLTDELGPKEEWKNTNHKSHSECEYSFRFCHNSFRFATGCNRDSNAFVWCFDKSNKKWDSIIIDINTKGDKKILRGKSKQSMDSLYVEEIDFSCDDKYMITNLSDNSIKVWNSESGELVQHFDKYHSDKISVIECHPVFGHIFISAGYDSNVFIYDILKGIVIKKFDCSLKTEQIKDMVSNTNEMNDIKPLLLQCSFSPDGQTIAATDNFGNLSIFSSESQKLSYDLDLLEEELLRIHSESDDESGVKVPEIMPSDKNLKLIESMFEYETDLLRGIEKQSPTKSIQSNEEKKSVAKKSLNFKKNSTVGRVLSTKKSLTKRKVTKKRSPVVKSTEKIANIEKSEEIESKPQTKLTEKTTESPKMKSPINIKQSKILKQLFTKILDEIFENPNSIPFQSVDHIQYPTYRKEISDADVSLSSIKEDLFANNRYAFGRFNRDMNSVFQNAKTFFKHRDEEIFEMALTLEKYYCNKMITHFGDAFKQPINVDPSDEDSNDNEVIIENKTSIPKTIETSKSLKTIPEFKKVESKPKNGDKTPTLSTPLREKSFRIKTLKDTKSSNRKESSKQTKSNDMNEKIDLKKTNGLKRKVSPIIKLSEQKRKQLKTTATEKSTDLEKVIDSTDTIEIVDTVNTSPQKSKKVDFEPKVDLSPKSVIPLNNSVVVELEEEEEDEELIENTGTDEFVANSEAIINGNADQIDYQKQSPKLKNSLFCIFCDKIFWEKAEATAHYILHLCPLKCSKCNQVFSNYDQYLGHSCGHPNTHENIEWCRHYSDSIVWIENFLQFQKSEDIESFEGITEQLKNCIVCEKVQQFRPECEASRVKEIKTIAFEQHMEKHLKYLPQFQCLICFLNEDKYFYCKSSVEAEHHLRKEHKTYSITDANPNPNPNALNYFDGSIPKLDEIIHNFYS